MHAERTPNPNSLKWVIGESITTPGTAASFCSPPSPEESPLASAVYAVEGVTEVFVAADFVTVSKAETVEWLDIAQPIVDAIRAHLASGQPALGPAFVPEPPSETERAPLVMRIKRVIDEEIRPAVSRDGGDVAFVAYQDGIVELSMKGACRGCPSATLTLKSAIETRLMQAIPEVHQVVAV